MVFSPQSELRILLQSSKGEVQRLTAESHYERVKELEERYANTRPLASLENDVEDLNMKVYLHLVKMGLT